MSNDPSEIRIYVACLAAYNNGILHGRWIDACQEERAIREEITAMLKASPIPVAEEFAIHDYEGFEGARIEEYQSIESVAALAEFIAEHGEIGGKLMDHFSDLHEARQAMEDRYCGTYRSSAEFAQDLTEESTAIPENIALYIDWQSMARDLEISDILILETGYEEVHIFWNQ